MQEEHKLVTPIRFQSSASCVHGVRTGDRGYAHVPDAARDLPGGERVHELFPRENLHVGLDDMVQDHDGHHAEADIYRG